MNKLQAYQLCEEVVDLLYTHQEYLQAVKKVKETTGLGLKYAKSIIDEVLLIPSITVNQFTDIIKKYQPIQPIDDTIYS